MFVRRWMSILLAVVMVALIGMPAAQAVEYETEVDSAPLTYSSDVPNGMVRVYLSSMGTVTRLDVTLAGSYTADGLTDVSLSANDTVQIRMDEYTGQLTMTYQGRTYAMGQEMALRRHLTNGTNGLRIKQSRRSDNLYPGDLQLVAKYSNGMYKLYPILHVYLEAYLNGVVPYEMSNASNLEALKAQSVAARTYTVRKMQARTNQLYDVVDTTSDQVYYGNSDNTANCTAAVAATKGIVLQYGSVLAGTYYSASNGGQTEAVRNVWGSTSMPYLSVKDDPFDLMSSAIRRSVTIYADNQHANQKDAVKTLLQSKAEKALTSMGYSTQYAQVTRIHSITPHTPKYASPSRLYTKMDFAVTVSTYAGSLDLTLTFDIFDELESVLGMSINANENELWSVDTDVEGFTLYARRHGHGVGMSQRGAVKMGVLGYTYDQILGFYYEGCQRVQYAFTHTILPPVGSGSQDTIVNTEPPAAITPSTGGYATVSLTSLNASLPIRYTAQSNGIVLTVANNGSLLTVLARGDQWTLVQLGQIVGYVPTAHLIFGGTIPTYSNAQPTALAYWATVTSSNSLNLREAGSYNARIITEMPRDSILAVFSIQDGWAHVQYGMQTGYASTDFMRLANSYPGEVSVISDTAYVSVTTGGVNLRKTASTSGMILTVVPNGQPVRVLSNDGSWCRVAYGSYEGYMTTRYLRFESDAGSDAPIVPTPTPEPVLPPAEPEENVLTAVVQTTSGSLNLRSADSKNSPVLTTIPRGASVIVTERGDTWCAVRYDGVSGYVMTKYLLFTSTEEEGGYETSLYAIVATEKGSLNLRKQPKTGSTVITTLPRGARVGVLAWGESWSNVTYGGYTGYAMTSFLAIDNSSQGGAQTPVIPDLPAPTPTPAPTVPPASSLSVTATVNTESGSLNLRAAASRSAAVLDRIPQHASVEVLDRGDSWSRVRYNGTTGYVMTSYLRFYQAVVSTSGGSLNLRAAATTSASILTTIPNGQLITLLEQGDRWCWVQYNNVTGYVMTRYLRIGALSD